MKIGITNDHRGVYLKQILTKYIEELGYNVTNYGTNTSESVDFPIYAFKLGDAIKSKEVDLGIAICGTGIGMSIALNKMKGITCAKVSNVKEATLCREHNNANVIALSEFLEDEEAKNIINKFLTTNFSKEEKYSRRYNLIKDKENE